MVVGPTAVGKTELALHLAKKLNGELVSADSRQVYKDLNIGTGKDVPLGSHPQNVNGFPVYQIDNIPVWGYDLVDAQNEFNVSQYVAAAKEIINFIWEKHKLPILVGGTGFYIEALIKGIDTMDIKPNKSLRKQLETMEVTELFEILARLDATKAASLNSSDKKNSVRLVRAIEVADANIRGKKMNRNVKPLEADVLKVGVVMSKEKHKEIISRRVHARVEDGIEQEIKDLLDRNVNWKDHSMSSLGYKEWKEYFSGKKTRNDVIEEWIQDECKYAKRQLTWFKRDKQINWYDPFEKNYLKKVEELAQKWYPSTKDENTKD